jgi:hypothetical protein
MIDIQASTEDGAMIERACADFCAFALPLQTWLRLPVTAPQRRQIRFMIGLRLVLGFFQLH